MNVIDQFIQPFVWSGSEWPYDQAAVSNAADASNVEEARNAWSWMDTAGNLFMPTIDASQLYFNVTEDGVIHAVVEEPKPDVGYDELCDILEEAS